jgi:mannose-6-phosphate isomerase-like protein (cupin superfamily)
MALTSELVVSLATVVLLEGALMPTLVAQPTRISAAGTKPKLIDEYIGRVNSKTTGVSVAHMRSPQGWEEPGQTPEFDEFTLVLKGMVRVRHKGGEIDVMPGQAVIALGGEWIQYSTPAEGGAEYIAVCLPAFSMQTVHRDE